MSQSVDSVYLPPELLVAIFQQADGASLSQASKVCTNWQAAAEDVAGKRDAEARIQEVLGRSIPGAKVQLIVDPLPELHITTPGNFEGLKTTLAIVEKCAKEKLSCNLKVSLPHPNESEAYLNYLKEWVAREPSTLKSLELSCLRLGTLPGINLHQEIRELKLSYNNIQGAGLDGWCDELSQLPCLKDLDLRGNPLNHDQVCRLAGALPQLEVLHLSGMKSLSSAQKKRLAELPCEVQLNGQKVELAKKASTPFFLKSGPFACFFAGAGSH